MTRDYTASESRNIRLVLAYDGTPYLGWQVQPQGPTVQSVLQGALERIIGERIVLRAAGRTDAGVHALGQVANFHTRASLKPEAFVRALNSMIPSTIAVLEADEVCPGFDARFSAVGKLYRYRVFNSKVASPFETNRSWLFTASLDKEKMKAVVPFLIGNIDFSSFRAQGCAAVSPVRNLRRCTIASEGPFITFELEADGFLRHMVRNIVGTLIEVGRGRFSTSEFPAIVSAHNRTRAGVAAPPQGLYLVRVDYPRPGQGGIPATRSVRLGAHQDEVAGGPSPRFRLSTRRDRGEPLRDLLKLCS
jgi:tRNA pseudouridine38-40 synthase